MQVESQTNPVKQNCWAVQRCGREPGGAAIAEFGVCPAAIDVSSDGLNGGKNAGRICWAVAGTLCEGRAQGSLASKLSSCIDCAFFKTVTQDEDARFLTVQTRAKVYANGSSELLEEQEFQDPPFLALGGKWPVRGSFRTLSGVEFDKDSSEHLSVKLWVS